MAETGQIRIIRDPKRAGLLQAINVTLITPTASAPSLPEKNYYQTKLNSVPLSLLLDPILRIPNLVGHTVSPLTETSASLIPNSLHLSVPKQSFHILGLQTSRRYAPPQSIPPSHRSFVPVCLKFPLTPKNLSRARWALAPDRFPRFDILLSAGSERINMSPGIDSSETEIERRKSEGWMKLPNIDDDEKIWETVESIQAVGTSIEDGGVEVCLVKYRGLCNTELVDDCLRLAKDVAKDSGWAAMLVRAPCAALVWRNGVSRGGFAEGFGGDAAEIIVCKKERTVAVQLRAGLDTT